MRGPGQSAQPAPISAPLSLIDAIPGHALIPLTPEKTSPLQGNVSSDGALHYHLFKVFEAFVAATTVQLTNFYLQPVNIEVRGAKQYSVQLHCANTTL